MKKQLGPKLGMLARLSLYVLALYLVPKYLMAHGGEDHGTAPHPTTTSSGREPSAGGRGDLYEVLVKYHHTAPGTAMNLQVYVADAKTNEPIADASVELLFSGSQELSATTTPTAQAGIYSAAISFPREGPFDVVANVTKGVATDLLTLGSIPSGLKSLSPSTEGMVPNSAQSPNARRAPGTESSAMKTAGNRWVWIGIATAVAMAAIVLRARARQKAVGSTHG